MTASNILKIISNFWPIVFVASVWLVLFTFKKRIDAVESNFRSALKVIRSFTWAFLNGARPEDDDE